MATKKLIPAVMLALLSCSSSPFHGYYFVGRVYDGATGAAVTGYSLTLQYQNQTLKASVDSNGRYYVGPLPPLQDFTIGIQPSSGSYRSFLSHNPMIVPGANLASGGTTGAGGGPGFPNQFINQSDESFYYDAYLFPTDVSTPSFNIAVTAADSATPPSTGTIRMRPTNHSDLYSSSVDAPAGVGSQLWFNSNDLQASTVTSAFTNGQLTVMAGTLIYGVTYEVAVYGVPGYQEFVTDYAAGYDGNLSVSLIPASNSTLALAFISNSLGAPVSNASLVMVFNQPIEIDPLLTAQTYTDSLNLNFSILSEVGDGGATNVLNPGTARGVTFAISNDTLTFSWDPQVGLAMSNPNVPILDVKYGGLGAFVIRPLNGDLNSSTALSTLLGTTTETVIVTAP
jgi:hypothetical protein